MRKLVYIAGPLTAETNKETARNVFNAIRAGQAVASGGFTPIVPHLSWYMEVDGWALTHEEWIDIDLALIDKADMIVMLDGWEDSKGSCQEYDHANEKGMPIYFGVDHLITEVRL
jgi:hypothetical protein